MKYRTYTEGGKTFIERIALPRFKAEVTFSTTEPSDIENIEWIDEPPIDVMKLSRLMRSASEYLRKGHQIMKNDEVKKMFSELIEKRAWYSGTSINRFQANEIKRRFNSGDLSIGRILEIFIECGYEIDVKK